MNEDDIKDDAEELDPDAIEEVLDDDETGLPLDLAGKKPKDLIDDEVESLDDLEDEELEEGEEADSFKDEYNQ